MVDQIEAQFDEVGGDPGPDSGYASCPRRIRNIASASAIR
jgi:hypothetical protein